VLRQGKLPIRQISTNMIRIRIVNYLLMVCYLVQLLVIW